MGLKQVIEERFDQLEDMLKTGNYEKASLLIPNITKFVSILTEEQRDFISSAKYAISQSIPWK